MFSWNGRRVLVTGGAGFLGSNLSLALAARGAKVAALDCFLEGGGANPANLRGSDVEIIGGDLRTLELAPVCDGVSVLFNLAAQTSHLGGQLDPNADIEINAVAQLRLIEALRIAAPDAIVVHASTRQFYGRVASLPVDETSPINPPDANGVTKFAGEQYWMLEHRIRRRPVVALRLTNCYGPRQRICDDKQGFLGVWLRCALQGKHFEVWDGRQLRDMTYVDDVSDAFIAAAEIVNCHGRAFNIGGTAPITLAALAALLKAVADGKASFVTRQFPVERSLIDIGSYYADDRAFRSASGWAPKIDSELGLRMSLEWFGKRLGDYVAT
jgi:nucleoside-diphosphate-sugar epimerase